MLGVASYPQAYIEGCRARMQAQLAAHKKLRTTAGKDKAARSALDAFDPHLFIHLTLVLDHYFVHRLRGKEGKDGNPLNEVRLLGASIMVNDGVLTADKTIRYKPEASVLGLEVGDRIEINEDGFRRLADAFFAELEQKFS